MIATLERHSRTIWLAVMALTLGGIFAASQLPVGLFPKINYPRVVVTVDAGDRDPTQMAIQITRPIEVALREIPGVSRVRSITTRGSADVALTFEWGQDMVDATQAVQGAMASLQSELPAGTTFEIRRSDPTTMFPAIGFALTSTMRDDASLRQFAQSRLQPILLGVPGVAKVQVLGGAPREFSIEIDPAKLIPLGLTPADVAQSLASANSLTGVGRIEDRHRLYLVMVSNPVVTSHDLEATPIKAGEQAVAGIVTLGQVATVRPSAEPLFNKVTSNGRSAVLVNVHQSLAADTVAIVDNVNKQLKTANVPADITVTTYYDQSELVREAAKSVAEAILLGAVLAGIVLLIFLRSWRLMVITGVTLPAVLAAASMVLYLFGLSFNMMTLGGMAAAVGLIVDDAVVMLEHMMRRMQESGRSSVRDLLSAAAEMNRPLFGSTTATIIVFMPLAFISGVTGGFFQALAVTMVAALVVSLLYARFVIPLVAAHWLREEDAEKAERATGFVGRLFRGYDKAADRTFARPVLAVALTAALLGLIGYVAYRNVPSGFMPQMDEGGFVLDYKAQSGAALSDTNRLLAQVEQIIRSTPDVAGYSRRTGLQFGGGLTEADEGDIFIRLKPSGRRPIEQVINEIREKVETQVPGLQIETTQLMGDVIGDLTAVPQPIEVKLFSDDPRVLNQSALRVGNAVSRIPGVVEVVNGLRVAGDAITVRVNRGVAAQVGLDPDSVSKQLEALIAGSVATQMRVGEQLVGVRVRGPADVRSRADEISGLMLKTTTGQAVPLRQIASIEVQPGQQQIKRENLASFVAVTGRLEGRDLGSAMKEVKSTVSSLKLPATVRVEYGGLYAEQQKSFLDLALVFAAAMLLTTMLITFLFERLDWTVAVIATVLLSAAAVLIGLWVTGIELNISALMGLTMVVGMVAELAIFYLAELDPAEPTALPMLRTAGAKRLRPIIMSALIAVLTLAPLALGLGQGAGLQKPLATAIIFGLTAGVPLVLLFLPALLWVIAERRVSRQPTPTSEPA
ncbi:efflux RND transporter permease subunit [Sphingomonas flavescens]|uniref:efflux RND transporter permease subunit n=1 Tax=Sphingomonas flavescens TaxID=3132797 RepID=UPI0028051E2D|nr:efflux RND transporter permease subunit [Sphingomonas limnosediminicola]